MKVFTTITMKATRIEKSTFKIFVFMKVDLVYFSEFSYYEGSAVATGGAGGAQPPINFFLE